MGPPCAKASETPASHSVLVSVHPFNLYFNYLTGTTCLRRIKVWPRRTASRLGAARRGRAPGRPGAARRREACISALRNGRIRSDDNLHEAYCSKNYRRSGPV